MEKTIVELQNELSKKDTKYKKLKERYSKLRQEVLERRRHAKVLVGQYERIVREWKQNFDYLLKNGWKIVIVKILEKYNKMRGR